MEPLQLSVKNYTLSSQHSCLIRVKELTEVGNSSLKIFLLGLGNVDGMKIVRFYDHVSVIGSDHSSLKTKKHN